MIPTSTRVDLEDSDIVQNTQPLEPQNQVTAPRRSNRPRRPVDRLDL